MDFVSGPAQAKLIDKQQEVRNKFKVTKSKGDRSRHYISALMSYQKSQLRTSQLGDHLQMAVNLKGLPGRKQFPARSEGHPE